MKKLFLLFLTFPLLVWAQATPNELVKSYVLMDAESGQILDALNPNEELPPASITKLMTAYVVFDALKNGKIQLTDKVPVSERAYRQEGSRMFIEIRSQVPVEDLIRGMIIQSGNDASIALAEYVGGSVENFVEIMNADAKKLGMDHTHYKNPTGLPTEGHYSTAHDIATLSRAIITQFPEYYRYYSEKSFRWNKITQPNRNRLLFSNANVDGLKTGHTEAAGYCLAASEKRGDIRLITAVLGAKKEADRFQASQVLLNIGFAQFTQVSPLKANQVLMQATVYKGEEKTVDVIPAHAVSLMMPKNAPTLKANVNLDTLIAPIKKGDTVGTITLTDGTKTYTTLPAIAAKNVPEGGFFRRSWDGLKLWWEN
ncbi:D-alanyl-D-alanine carboxypeptidase family protein [Suttonella ornithocola]|uniref:serine-type D-Ala-D-Ala carboxypeptidase n=1 Tax=Suttonella ornithocola TaxID=279832 RepID=A0A380MND0_9GAMM|nr:D-alanyl-D-alanine carboxypeptidase family protein [Suttonella ornithocola]SUO94135.1 D-alanyl-D-alanine carboxypeptidase dacC precursor [Suttonella ornithocola]